MCSIGVGTGNGTLQVTQATLNGLANFTTLGIGTGDAATGLVTINGAVTLHTTTGFGGKGDGASVVLGSQAAITTTAADGSGIGFFSGSGGSFTQNRLQVGIRCPITNSFSVRPYYLVQSVNQPDGWDTNEIFGISLGLKVPSKNK